MMERTIASFEDRVLWPHLDCADIILFGFIRLQGFVSPQSTQQWGKRIFTLKGCLMKLSPHLTSPTSPGEACGNVLKRGDLPLMWRHVFLAILCISRNKSLRPNEVKEDNIITIGVGSWQRDYEDDNDAENVILMMKGPLNEINHENLDSVDR